jgi:hypothetical protein
MLYADAALESSKRRKFAAMTIRYRLRGERWHGRQMTSKIEAQYYDKKARRVHS